jgi:CspA family cold shock protein
MEQGTVKWFDDKKGFGFIIRQNGEEAFAHFSDIVAKGHRNLTTGQRVEFDVVDNGPKGARATQITVIG